jgi:hypothetical protein
MGGAKAAMSIISGKNQIRGSLEPLSAPTLALNR